MKINYLLLYTFSVFIASFSQVLLKKSASKRYANKIYEMLNPLVLSAYFILVISLLLTTLALRGVPYKYSAVVESLGYIFILILSVLILKEKISKRHILGNLIIIFGIIIFTL